MESRVYLLVTTFILHVILCAGQWPSPFYVDLADTENSWVGEADTTNRRQPISMLEENEVPIRVVALSYTGGEQPILQSMDEPNSNGNQTLGLTFDEEGGVWYMVVNARQDYESSIFSVQKRYAFVVVAGGETVQTFLNIQNIDDNQPLFQASNQFCEIEENRTAFVTDCSYTILDADGWLQNISWSLGDQSEIFDFEYSDISDITDNTQTQMTVYLRTLRPLDFETNTLHLIDVTVEDSRHSTGTRVIVRVEDIADTPPMWRSIFASQTFDEKTDQEFRVEAVDGDIAINDVIFYEITETNWSEYISIGLNSGIITVLPINRDALQTETYTFLIRACEVNNPTECVQQQASFLVNDINDNYPIITTTERNFTIPENQISTLEVVITGNDIDLGPNAMYDIILEDHDTMSYTQAFTVVPNRGYQETDVFLFIRNATPLDFEDEEWRSFSFDLVTIENMNASHTDRVTFNIELENLNDEVPIFAQEEYNVNVSEIIGADEFIEIVRATDRDIGDSVIHSLLGNAILNMLIIDPESGEIRTRRADAFNYEIQEEVIVQVQAVDTLLGGGNRAIAQLTIFVQDVNDETPRISVSSTRIEIYENSLHDDEIGADTTITATDDDTTAFLVFTINWDDSFATKNGRQLTPEEFNPYREWISIDTINDDATVEGVARNVRAKLTVHEVVTGETPDFELFDTMYVSLIVNDTQQEVNPGTNIVTLLININNVNDERPVFDVGTLSAQKTVTEHANEDAIIAIIIATDQDSPILTYSLSPSDEMTPPGLVNITSRGELTVIGDIDADLPLYTLTYNVIASDGEFETAAEIQIEVRDTNDNTPQLEIIATQYVEEGSENGTLIVQITATDADRDAPFNLVFFQWSGVLQDQSLRQFFSIDLETGVLSVQYQNPNNILDRDNGIPAVDINIMVDAVDNFYGNPRLTSTTSFRVILTDINNQAPVIQTTALETSEDVIEETVIGTITATDADEPGSDNSRIQFEVVEILRGPDANKDPPQDLFGIVNQNYDAGTAILATNYFLRDYHGTYSVAVRATDFGEEPLSSTGYVAVTVNKFNFNPPAFIFPNDASSTVYLRNGVDLNTQLILYNDDYLADISATDNQGQKWVITFTLEEETETFYISNRVGNEARLFVQEQPIDNHRYQLIITATDNGTPQFNASVAMTAVFIDMNADPAFDQTAESLEFLENTTDIPAKVFPNARFLGVDEDMEFPVYYFIRGDPTNAFTIPTITVNEIVPRDVLDREDVAFYDLEIIASRSPSGSLNPDDTSILQLHVQVLDINDNPPNFAESEYFDTIMATYELERTILTVSATDLDENPTLTYSIEPGSLVAVGNNIQISNPFDIIASTGSIRLQFAVVSTMSGFFTFNVIVDDTLYTDTTSVKIFIVTEAHGVEFTFVNNIDTVLARQNEVISILQDEFIYRCNIESIRRNTDANGEQMDTQTVVRVHFIDAESNEPVDRTQIENTANDVNVYSRLREAFLEQGLDLLSFIQGPEDEDNTADVLRGWLIGVSVVLGVLCVILLVAFILKTRSLSTRLNKLQMTVYGSQESGLNRKTAPTTNKHAIEGSNPVYNIETKVQEYDATSVGSGDSDLIGVENNPEFDYNPQERNGSAWTTDVNNANKMKY